MNILITGASGLIGSSLVEFFVNQGHSLYSLQRNIDTESDSFWNFDRLTIIENNSPFDAVIHLAGENIANGRWTRRKKERILKSRTDGTKQLAEYCAGLDQQPDVFLSASAIGFYGDQGATLLDESSPTGTNFVAEVCREWEKAANPAQESGMRLVNARIGMVLSNQGGTLSSMLPSFKLGVAGIVGSGKQYVSWVDIRDIAAMFLFLIENKQISGPVNLVSPHSVTNRQFTKTLGKVVNRPTVMKMPAFVARTVFGQMGNELILSSTRVVPKVLLNNGYPFISTDLEKTLLHCTS